MIFWNRLMSWVPAIMLFGILGFIYSIYFIYYIKPQISYFSVEFILLHLIILLFLISLFRSMLIEPGPISQEIIEETWKQWDEFQQQEKERLTEQRQRRSQRSVKTFKTENDEDRSVVNMDADENMEDDYSVKKEQQNNSKGIEKRFCKKCCIPKPLRTHHCSQCRQCWQRMDHHCQWINNCVAKNNYKVFICMIFYASFLLIWVSISHYKTFIQILETDIADVLLFIIILHYYFILLLSVMITGFFIFHVYLISQNKTTLEQLEDKPDRSNYNQGIWNNFKNILGSNILLWILPTKL